MLRQILLLLNVFPILFLINSTELKKEELKVELLMPETAEIGSEFIAQLKITGGNVSGFAKYIDNLPRGLSAEPVEMGDATFTADNGQIKILWVNFPKSDELVLKFKIKVGENAPEMADFGGKFSYLEGNEKKVYSVFKKQIKFGSAEQLAEASKANEPVPVTVSVVRHIVNSRDNVHHIELEIKQTGLEGFGKIQEFVPLGAKVEQGETQNAAYSQIKNKVKFVWMSLPKTQSFKVSYYVDLSAADNKDVKSITGNFSYLDHEVTKKIDILFGDSEPVLADATVAKTDSDENVVKEANSKTEAATENNEIKPKEPTEEIALVPLPPGKTSDNTEKKVEDTDEGKSVDKNNEMPLENNDAEEAVVAQNLDNQLQQEEAALANNSGEPAKDPVVNPEASAKKEANTSQTATTNNTAAVGKRKNSSESTISTAQSNNTGVRYRVQVAAGKNVVGPEYFLKKHNFSREFNVENHQGWVKYTTGSFSVYRDARNSREEINAGGHNFDGPFVTAYNQGTRITVQEALMISSQKWFK